MATRERHARVPILVVDSSARGVRAGIALKRAAGEGWSDVVLAHVQGATGVLRSIVREGAVGENLVAGEFHRASTDCRVAIEGAVLRCQS